MQTCAGEIDIMKSIICLLILLPSLVCASTGSHQLLDAKVDLTDKASLQRGAKWYMNYCAGCHSLSYQRYKRTAEDIGIAYYTGQVDEKLLKENLIFTDAKIGDRMENAMSTTDAKKWFGVAPPDLTLETRVRGSDWVYTYLLSFYEDDKTQWGTNNSLFKDVAMPNVLVNLQGRQLPVYRTEKIMVDGNLKKVDVIDHIQNIQAGTMDQLQFEQVVHDIVNFLTYVGTPNKLHREQLGIYVLLFLGLMISISYALKKEFWRDIKKIDKK